MTEASDRGFGRRAFLQRMALAGAAPLAPALLGADAASAQTEAPKSAGAEHQTERLAAYGCATL